MSPATAAPVEPNATEAPNVTTPSNAASAQNATAASTTIPNATYAFELPVGFGRHTSWRNKVLVDIALDEYEKCRYGQSCWRGEVCFYRHLHDDGERELTRLRLVAASRSARTRLAGSAPSGLDEASSFKLSLGEQRDHGSTEDEAALLAKYNDDCCKGCGYHPDYGCASSCPLLSSRAEDGADQMSDDEKQACSDSEYGDLAQATD